MSKFVPTSQTIIPQAIDETSTTKKLPLGTRVEARDVASTDYGVGEFIYLEGVASTVVGSVVLIDQDDFSTSLATANDVGYLAVAMSANLLASASAILLSSAALASAILLASAAAAALLASASAALLASSSAALASAILLAF